MVLCNAVCQLVYWVHDNTNRKNSVILWLWFRALSYYSDLTLSQSFQPMGAQLSKKAALPLAKIIATASCRSGKPRPRYVHMYTWNVHLVPVPLSIFRSNSKFDENSELSSFEYTRPTTTIFCTRHDSDTVVTCAKYRCDRSYTFYTRVFWIFIEFRILSKYA